MGRSFEEWHRAMARRLGIDYCRERIRNVKPGTMRPMHLVKELEILMNNAQLRIAAAKMRIVRERAKRAERKRERWLRKEIEG